MCAGGRGSAPAVRTGIAGAGSRRSERRQRATFSGVTGADPPARSPGQALQTRTRGPGAAAPGGRAVRPPRRRALSAVMSSLLPANVSGRERRPALVFRLERGETRRLPWRLRSLALADWNRSRRARAGRRRMKRIEWPAAAAEPRTPGWSPKRSCRPPRPETQRNRQSGVVATAVSEYVSPCVYVKPTSCRETPRL